MKLVTFNTQWCRGLDGAVDPRRIVEAARALADFDALCLQEVAHNYPGLPGDAGHDQPALLEALLPGFRLFFGAAVHEFTKDGESRFGNCVATRLPVRQVQHHPLPYPADAGVPSMPRMCTVVTVDAPGLGLVRIMATHLEFYSKVQRMAQARALRELHLQYSAQAAEPPQASDDGSPFRTKAHTAQAVLCGDFNLEPHEPEHRAITEPAGACTLHDAWEVLHGDTPRPPTFCVFDRTYGPEPIACDFVFVTGTLAPRVRRFAVDGETRVSDHQPVCVEFA